MLSWKDESFVQGLHRPSNVLPERLLSAPVLDGLYIVPSLQETCPVLCPTADNAVLDIRMGFL